MTSIGNNAFSYCSGLTSVTIPGSVTSIGYYAFRGCSGLTSVTIPNSVTIIGGWAFSDCRGLTSVTIPGSVTSIGNNAFYGCTGLTSVTIPNSVTSIGYKAFEGCRGLTSITIPNSVTTIGGSAFYGCYGLTSVTIPNSVTTIGEMAFEGCSGLQEVNFNADNCTSMGSSRYPVFSGCTALTTLRIGNIVKNIPSYAFYNTYLKSVTIGSGVLSIGSNAFPYSNSSSGEIPIKVIWLTNTPPNGYGNVSAYAHYVANDLYTKLSNKTVYPFLSSVFEADGVKYVPVSPSERTCDAIDCLYDESTENVRIGETVNYRGIDMTVRQVHPYAFRENSYIKKVDLALKGDVGRYAFSKCSKLQSIVIPDAVTGIGGAAFEDCTSLESATIGSGVSIINSYAFVGCTNLSDLKIGSNVATIDEYAFSRCSSLPKVVIPSKVVKIGNYAFNECTKLKEVIMEEREESVQSSEKRTFSNWTSTNNGQNNSTSSNTWTFDVEPGDVLSLDYSVSSEPGYDKLIITLDGKIIVEVSGEKTAFYSKTYDKYCTAILIASYVKDEYKYGGSDQASVYNISVNFSDALSLGSNGSNPLFSSCPLDSVYIGRNISYSTSSSYGYSPFYRNTSLRSVTITDKETEISPNEFYGCSNLKNVSIGDGVETIGNWAFSGCSSLDYFSFGSSVKTIGQEAFSDCTAMTRLISHATTPPTCGSQALDDINKWNCTLSVPEGTTSAYQAAEQWKEFFFINNDIVTGVHQVDSGELTVDSWYTIDGKKLASEPTRKGVYIVNGKKVMK